MLFGFEELRMSPPGSTSNKERPKRGQRDVKKPATPVEFTTPVPKLLAGSSDHMDIVKTITDCLLNDELVEKLVGKLAEKLKDTVVESLSEALKEAEGRIEQLNTEISSLKLNASKFTKRNDDLEQYTRRNSVRVFGIRETKGEDTDDKVIRVFKEKLNLDIQKTAIDRSHRVGQQPEPNEDGSARWRPIIVKFVSYREKRLVYEKKKLLKGSRITIREDLTARRLEVWKTAVDRFGLKNTWTSDGRILWTKDGQKGSATCLSDIPPK